MNNPMNPHALHAADIETAFLAGVEAKLNPIKGKRLEGTAWSWTTQSQEDHVREKMAELRLYDRDLLHAMPKNKSRILTGTASRWLFWRRKKSVAVAAVLTDLDHYLQHDNAPPPVGLHELTSHINELIGKPKVPHLVGICSPTGFDDETKTAGVKIPNVTAFLIEPRKDGGWIVIPASPNASKTDAGLFDPEDAAAKLKRVRKAVEADRVDLLTGGLSASAIGEKLGLPVQLVAMAFEQMAAEADLKTSPQGKDVLLYRGAANGVEDNKMSMMDRLKQLLSREGDEKQKIDTLSERRVKLAQRRDQLYGDISQLEGREKELLKQGKESSSPSVKRRVATQIKQLRNDMDRLNATAKMLGQQVEVISTHIHNLTLIQQGQIAKLPTSEELTKDAVRAEEMIEQLGAEVSLADSLSTGVSDITMSDEELEILKELEEPATAADEAQTQTESPTKEPPLPEAEEPEKREPEAG